MTPGPADDGRSHDPFGTRALRESTLRAWASSPTRLREDHTAEADLTTIGYRDRMFTELAANAADAAAAADPGSGGRMAVWLDERDLHVANTGEPLTPEGVRSLVALRVSAKKPARDQIGRFGVGFTSTATVADGVEIRSTSGSIRFDLAATEDAVRAAGIERDRAGGAVPLLRLAWPVDAGPVEGFATEVVLHLRPDVDADALLETISTQVPDLLVALDALDGITVGDGAAARLFTVEQEPITLPRNDRRVTARRLVVRETSPQGSARTVRSWREVSDGTTRWLVAEADESDGAARMLGDLRPHHIAPSGPDVLYAPTATDIELGLPCRVITTLPLTPDRRHLHPSADITDAASGYVELMQIVEPGDRVFLIPSPQRVRNADDARLTEAILEQLRDSVWLPGADGGDLVPVRAVCVAGLGTELAEILSDAFADLVHPDISAPQHLPALERVGVTPLSLAQVAERLIGVDRPARWWHRLYAALGPLVPTAREAEELSALPVPRADGRMSVGARGLVSIATPMPLRWLPTVDPDADHPLLDRLGLQRIEVTDALADPGLREMVSSLDESLDSIDVDPDDSETAGSDMRALVDEILGAVRADPHAIVPDWLRGLPIPDADGGWRPADELLLPNSPLLSVLVDDHPFGLVSDDLIEEAGADALRRIGVGWGFMTVTDDLPTAPDHDLPDEEQWWDERPEPPETLAAVRDLDLVDEDRWADALTLLATDEALAPLLARRDGYTCWWLRQHAWIDGHRLGWYRAPADTAFDGVRDVLDHPHADALRHALGGSAVESAADADDLLRNLGDPQRTVSAGTAAEVYAVIVATARRGVFEPADLAVPERIRVVSGGTSEAAVVIDEPWWVQVFDPGEMVVMGAAEHADAELLAEILDVPIASEAAAAEVDGEGSAATGSVTEAVLLGVLTGRRPRRGEVRLHDTLTVRVRHGGDERTVPVDWWVDDRGITHLRRRGTAVGHTL